MTATRYVYQVSGEGDYCLVEADDILDALVTAMFHWRLDSYSEITAVNQIGEKCIVAENAVRGEEKP